MIKASAIIAVSVMSLAYGCATHPDNSAATIAAPHVPPPDKKLIKADNQAAELALRSDHQAIVPTTLATTTTHATDQIVSSLRIAVAHIKPSGQASTQPADQNIEGTVTFTQIGSLVIVVADLSGFEPNSTHTLEIHDSADLSSPDLSSAGDRWTVAGSDNAAIGMLGDIDADSTGRVYFERTLGGVTVGHENNLVGHSVILLGQPTGNVGASLRVAGGVIERHDQ